MLFNFRSDEYEAAQLALLKSFENSFERYKIPCFMAFGEKTGDAPLDYRYVLLFDVFRFLCKRRQSEY